MLGSKTSLFSTAEHGVVWGKLDIEPVVTSMKRTGTEKYRMLWEFLKFIFR